MATPACDAEVRVSWELVEGFGGGAPSEGLAGSGVERERDGVEIVAGVAGEVGAGGSAGAAARLCSRLCHAARESRGRQNQMSVASLSSNRLLRHHNKESRVHVKRWLKRLRGDSAVWAAQRRSRVEHDSLAVELDRLRKELDAVRRKVNRRTADSERRLLVEIRRKSGRPRLGRLDDLERYPETERPDTPAYLNIGAGRFTHPLWHNLDNPSDWYADRQQQLNIAHDLMSDEPFPLDSDTLKVAYSSHVIEHLSDQRVAEMFAEVYRVLRPGGFFRVACPDMGYEYDAFARGDYDYFYWRRFPHKVLDRSQPVEQMFLAHFAAACVPKHPDPRLPKYRPEQVREVFETKPREEFFEFFCRQVPEEVQRDHPGNHCNWFDVDKVVGMLRRAGFGEIYESRYGQSRCAVLRNTLLFDNSRPTCCLYVEAIK